MKLALTIILTTAFIAGCHSLSLRNAKSVPVKVEARDDRFHVQFSHDNKDYALKLSRPGIGKSIFTKDFKFLIAKVNSKGETEFDDVTPPIAQLEEIENRYYVDRDAFAVLKVHEKDGQYRLEGTIDNIRIHHRDDQHFVSVVEPPPVAQNPAIKDYVNIDYPRPLVRDPRLGRQAGITYANPEVAVVFDYANTQKLGGNIAAITDYLGVMFHAINDRYLTVADPKIVFQISGIVTPISRTEQPYMESGKIQGDVDNAYDMNIVLSAFAKWTYSNSASLPKFDNAALISGENWKSKVNGVYQKGIAGLAYVGSTCLTDSWSGINYGTSVNADQGAFYEGVNTIAHELAHNTGSPHDGEDTNTCSWNDGFIMSYLGYGAKNKWYFSECSKQLMKQYLSSTQAACVRSYQSPTQIPANPAYPGDRYNLNAQCARYLNIPNAVVEPSVYGTTSVCRTLKCRVNTSNGYSIYTLNGRIVHENSVCGNNMVCRNGDCITMLG